MITLQLDPAQLHALGVTLRGKLGEIAEKESATQEELDAVESVGESLRPRSSVALRSNLRRELDRYKRRRMALAPILLQVDRAETTEVL